MRKIFISDMTLREYSDKADLSFKEKVEIFKQLDKLKVDYIETAADFDNKADALLIKTFASLANNSCISVPVGFTEESVDLTWESVKGAKKKRLTVAIPVSTVQMEYICGKKPKAVLEMINTLVSKAKSYCDEVEFLAEDATRSEMDFLATAIKTAIEAGATTVTISDLSGKMMPDSFVSYIEELKKNVPELDNVKKGIKCSDQIDMASANSLLALKSGADEVKVVSAGYSYPRLAVVSELKRTLDFESSVNITELQRSTNQINWIIKTEKSKNSPFDSGVSDNEPNILLIEGDDISVVGKAVEKLGYDLSAEDLTKVYDAFTKVKGKKEVVAKELDAIVASVALQVPPTYKLSSYVINSGNVITAMANVNLEKNGEIIEGISAGDGPIDAAFLAIEQIVGVHYELDDFQIQAVTEGREAMGSALIKLRSNGKLYSGKGISTDIIGASISAYINALNKIVYEEN